MKRFELTIKIPCEAMDDKNKKMLVESIISKLKHDVGSMTITINEDYIYDYESSDDV